MTPEHENRLTLTFKSMGDDDSWIRDPLRSLGWESDRRSNTWRPPTDLMEREDAFLILVEIAGMRGAEFSVTYDEQIITIQGLRAGSQQHQAYHRMEIDYGEFVTQVRLPSPVDSSRIEAVYSDGFLRVVLPKAGPRSIKIEE